MTEATTKSGLHCSFCAKHQDDVALIIAGISGYICSECVAVTVNVIADAASRKARTYFLRPEDVPQESMMKIVEEAMKPRPTPTDTGGR